MTKNDLIAAVKSVTDKAIIEVDGFTVTISVPRRKVSALYCYLHGLTPAGMCLAVKPMSWMQWLRTWAVKFYEVPEPPPRHFNCRCTMQPINPEKPASPGTDTLPHSPDAPQ